MRSFSLRVLVLLPATIAVWWFTVDHLLAMLLPLVDWLARWLFGERLIGIEALPYEVEHRAALWMMKTNLVFQHKPLAPYVPTFDPIRFSIGLPLLWALCFANNQHRLRNFALGTALYIPTLLMLMLIFINGKFAFITDMRISLETAHDKILVAVPAPYLVSYLSDVGAKMSELLLPPVMPVLIWLLISPEVVVAAQVAGRQHSERNDFTKKRVIINVAVFIAAFCIALTAVLALTYDRRAMVFQRGQQAFFDKRYDEALRILRPLAQKEAYAPAQHQLGMMYIAGLGVPRNLELSFFWHNQAAVQGHVHAQFHLANAFLRGIGVPQSLSDAYFWFRRLAQQGYVPAQYQVGVMLENGSGVQKDEQEARSWYALAASNGYKKAG